MLPLIARIVVGAVFAVAGTLKVGHPDDLAAAITAWKLGLPPLLVAFIAVALPVFEILLGIYLLGGWLLGLSAVVSTALLLAFIGALISVIVRGISAPCGCFGSIGTQPVSWWEVLRDSLLLVLSVYLLWWSRARARSPWQ